MMMPTHGTSTISTWGGSRGQSGGTHTPPCVWVACWGRAVALDLRNFDLAGRCSANEEYNYVQMGRVRVALRMIRVKRAEARNRGDALTVTMYQSADTSLASGTPAPPPPPPPPVPLPSSWDPSPPSPPPIIETACH